ncbi:hypothetical protein COOONC_26187, partial [Cooperia oncophora]
MRIHFKEAALLNGRCWGYERNCTYEKSYSAELGVPKCSPSSKRERFYKQADFGYVAERSNMHDICSSQDQGGSSLRCSDDLRYCQAANIFFHFKSWNAKNSKRYREDVVQRGEVGGNCEKFNSKILKGNLNERGYLRRRTSFITTSSQWPSFTVDDEHCDIIFERPTIVMKLDASVNMYHHFCDFVNLYASQHINGSFNQQVDHCLGGHISSGGFVDTPWFATRESIFLDSSLSITVMAGRRFLLLMGSAMFPLLARQAFGLYYNTPLVSCKTRSSIRYCKSQAIQETGCHGTGLMHAFAHHILHRLRIEQEGPLLDNVRVTILSRGTNFQDQFSQFKMEGRKRSGRGNNYSGVT